MPMFPVQNCKYNLVPGTITWNRYLFYQGPHSVKQFIVDLIHSLPSTNGDNVIYIPSGIPVPVYAYYYYTFHIHLYVKLVPFCPVARMCRIIRSFNNVPVISINTDTILNSQTAETGNCSPLPKNKTTTR